MEHGSDETVTADATRKHPAADAAGGAAQSLETREPDQTWALRNLIKLTGMEWFDKRTASVLSTILLFAAAGAFLYGARRVLVAFLFAIFFAYLLDPLVSRLHRWRAVSRGSRGLAVLEVYVILCLALAIVLLVIGPRIADEGRKLGQALPGLLERLSSGEIVRQIGSSRGWSYNSQLRLETFLADHRDTILTWVGAVGRYLAGLAQNVIWLVLIPILALFFLKDGRTFTNNTLELVERRRQRQFLAGILEDLNAMLAHYIRAQLVLAGLSIVVYMAVLSALHVPYSSVLGLIAGMMEFIPVVGPLAAAAAVLGVAFVADYAHLLIVAGFLAGWRLLQDYVTAPRIMGGKLRLHPLAVIFAVLAGAEIGGVIGVYLSIPILASLRIVWTRWRRLYAEGPPGIKAA
jgi:predicted PurR-regulated permease PerM